MGMEDVLNPFKSFDAMHLNPGTRNSRSVSVGVGVGVGGRRSSRDRWKARERKLDTVKARQRSSRPPGPVGCGVRGDAKAMDLARELLPFVRTSYRSIHDSDIDFFLRQD